MTNNKCPKSRFHENSNENLDVCNSRVIRKYHPSDVHINSYTIGLIGMT